MRTRPLRPSDVPSNLGVASGLNRDVFAGTAALDFFWVQRHHVVPPVPAAVDGAASGSTFAFSAMVAV